MEPKQRGSFFQACGTLQLVKVPIQLWDKVAGFVFYKYMKRNSMKAPEQSLFSVEKEASPYNFNN